MQIRPEATQEVTLLAANNRIQFYLFQLRLEGERTCSCHLYQLNTHIRGLPHVYNTSNNRGMKKVVINDVEQDVNVFDDKLKLCALLKAVSNEGF